MNIKENKANLAQTIVMMKRAKIDVANAVKDNQLIEMEDLEELRNLALIIIADAETVDSFLGEYKRMGISGKRAATLKSTVRA